MSGEAAHLVEDSEAAAEILRRARRVGVLGIKPESRAHAPAHYVPAYLQRAGYEIVPVPVYYPGVTEILGEPVYRSLAAVPGTLDLVVVFRRSRDVAAHLEDFLQARPRAVWMQSGIRDEDVARRLAEAGIDVVQDRCTMVEHRFSRHRRTR